MAASLAALALGIPGICVLAACSDGGPTCEPRDGAPAPILVQLSVRDGIVTQSASIRVGQQLNILAQMDLPTTGARITDPTTVCMASDVDEGGNRRRIEVVGTVPGTTMVLPGRKPSRFAMPATSVTVTVTD